jgi:hypothetical protein
LRQDMHQEAADELVGIERHQPVSLGTCCGMPADSLWLIRGTIRGRCKLTLAIATSSTRCAIPSCHPIGSRTFGDRFRPDPDPRALPLASAGREPSGGWGTLHGPPRRSKFGSHLPCQMVPFFYRPRRSARVMHDRIRGEQGQVAIGLPLWMVAPLTAGSAKFIGPSANASVLWRANAIASAIVVRFTACSYYRLR